MATFKSTTFGKISGKYGEALATKSKVTGKNYLRVASVPSNPRTAKQLAHRAKFGFINSVLRPFYPIYKITLGGNVGIRYAISDAFKNAIVGEYPDYAIDLTQLIFTHGALYNATTCAMIKAGEGKLKIDWDATTLAGTNPMDSVSFIFYNETTDQAMMLNPQLKRSAATTIADMPAIWLGANIHCWMYFTAPDGITNSTSQYVSSVEL